MLELEPPPAAGSLRHLLHGLLAASLAALSLWVLAPFLTSIAWAVILAYVSWPAFRPLRKACNRSPTMAALVMIVLVTCVLLIPLLWLLVLLHNELIASFKPITASLGTGAHPSRTAFAGSPGWEPCCRSSSTGISPIPPSWYASR